MVRQAKADLGRSFVKHKYDSAINRLGDGNNTEAIGADDTNQHRCMRCKGTWRSSAKRENSIMSHFMFQLHELEEHHSHRSLIMPKIIRKSTLEHGWLVLLCCDGCPNAIHISCAGLYVKSVREIFISLVRGAFSNTGTHHPENGLLGARRNKWKKGERRGIS